MSNRLHEHCVSRLVPGSARERTNLSLERRADTLIVMLGQEASQSSARLASNFHLKSSEPAKSVQDSSLKFLSCGNETPTSSGDTDAVQFLRSSLCKEDMTHTAEDREVKVSCGLLADDTMLKRKLVRACN